ncbi:IclR family transcriptional regulator C-terminal domain-containing protein [Arthrobacter sp. ISL-65]|uniref:IclR family transcriptional regulator domain-containing protein n=1 Tax=Arthrobacter sp. ISL-65 TaxID=2819112 RepID=UPI001BECEB05|nr:IclR family transcriptional regulator C-terminal domain-containing protein [Arthrobacter sp. ISL-65]MBT2551392.1 hypothetical protein [Arthrobacter sp. ISL-65]
MTTVECVLQPEDTSARISGDAGIQASELENIRSQGWAATDSERVPDAHGIAAPFFVDGAATGSVTVTVPNHRVAGAPADELVAAVVKTAHRLTRLLSVEQPARVATEQPEATRTNATSTPLTMGV